MHVQHYIASLHCMVSRLLLRNTNRPNARQAPFSMSHLGDPIFFLFVPSSCMSRRFFWERGRHRVGWIVSLTGRLLPWKHQTEWRLVSSPDERELFVWRACGPAIAAFGKLSRRHLPTYLPFLPHLMPVKVHDDHDDDNNDQAWGPPSGQVSAAAASQSFCGIVAQPGRRRCSGRWPCVRGVRHACRQKEK